jgi:hypothetical protein
MTHEERLALAIQFNKEIIANRLAGQITVKSFIKANTLNAEELGVIVDLYPDWVTGISYKIDDVVKYNGKLYIVIQTHTSLSNWTPDVSASLFTVKAPIGIIPEWKQPTGSTDAYKIGDRVTFNGNTYESLINANTWSPTVYPQGWKLITL